MKLKCDKISKWDTNESHIGLVAPMSPMLATKDFISKVVQEDAQLTGLFRLNPVNPDEKTFTTEEDMDLYPVEADVLVAMMISTAERISSLSSKLNTPISTNLIEVCI